MFLRSRTRMKSVVTEVEDVVGRSSLLLASLLNSPLNATDASDMIVDETEPEIRCMYWSYNFYLSLSPQAIYLACNYSTASEASSDALNIPFNAHILPGCGKRLNCLLPVVCVAPEHEIGSLVTAVVCQRYVLDITLPVVGVSLSNSGTTAKIILGWTDDDRDDVVGTVPLGWIINMLTMSS